MDALKDFAQQVSDLRAPAAWGWTPDSRSQHWPLLDLAQCLGLILAYLVMIPIGKALMANRKPFDLYWIRVIHNAYMVGLSGYMCWTLTFNTMSEHGRPWCLPTTHTAHGDAVAAGLWWFYISKPIEFIDTIIMVLRKKNDQISFLHVYHHSSIFLMWYVNVFYNPGGDAWFAAAFNTLVHVLMYSYYFFASFGYKAPWKKYLTLFQIIQFCSFVGQAIYGIMNDCNETRLLLINLLYAGSLLALFLNFYVSSYSKNKGKGKGKGEAKGKDKAKAKGAKSPRRSKKEL